MGSEASLRDTARRAFPGDGHWVRIENAVEQGTPDLWVRCCGVGAWIELKYSARWPARRGTPLRCDHLTDEQRRWAVAEGRAGGCYGLLWQVGSEYLLFGWRSIGRLGQASQEEMRELALWAGPAISWPEIMSRVDRDCTATESRSLSVPG